MSLKVWIKWLWYLLEISMCQMKKSSIVVPQKVVQLVLVFVSHEGYYL